MADATEQNRAYYERLSDGRRDYWRYMAAPRHRVQTIRRELRRAAPRSVVDLGCGNGQLLRELAADLPGAKLCGVDLSEPQIAVNRVELPSIDWLAADLSKVTEAANRFDAVVASEIIEHVQDPLSLLRSAAAFAREDGLLVLTTQSGPVRATERSVGHVRHFSAAEIRDLLDGSGWEPLRVWNEGFPFHDLSKWYASLRADSTMAQFGESAYGWKEKGVCAALRLLFRFNSRRSGAQLFATARRRS